MISVCGVAVATMATVCILSVLNGFQGMVADMFSAFDPELKITPAKGKVFNPETDLFLKIYALPEINSIAESLEDNVLLSYRERQVPAILKGVSDNYTSLINIKSILIDGEMTLSNGESYFTLLGMNLANALGVNASFVYPMEVFAPKRNAKINLTNPASSYNKEYVFISGVFRVNQAKYDENYMIVPISAARSLFDYENEVSALEIKLKAGVSVGQAQSKIEKILGDAFEVKDRYQQQEDSFKMINIEKWVAFLILCFILLVAAFNIIGSLSMLIIDKQADVGSLRNMGAGNRLILRIFLFEGWMISAIGAFAGIVTGFLLCLGQQYYGWLKLGTSGSFAIEAYPIVVSYSDLSFILVVVLSIGFLSVLYPVRYLSKKWLG
jgi:ABC-type lipoprotein release transport system permease subunit